MTIGKETLVKDIAVASPAARHVLENAGVDYRCGGSKSLSDACLQANVSADEILQRIRENAANVAPEDANWTQAPLHELTRHIREKHHTYVREAIRHIHFLADKVESKHGANHPEVAQIRKLFDEVAQEMTMHMRKEEQILFPYIDGVEHAHDSKTAVEPPFFGTVRNPIQMMMREHDAAGELVRQIHQASGNYTPPADACVTYQSLCQELRQFEADLHQHVHLENNILFPRALEVEAAVFG
jgi:regulator of cell morphogenesis and NO signaling